MSDTRGNAPEDPVATEAGPRSTAPEDPMATEAGSRSTAPHRHRILIGSLIALASLIGVFAVLAVWLNRQVLNTKNWTSTSSRLLADKEIQTAVAGYTVTQVFKSGVVEREIKSVLPAKLQPVAAPAAAGLQQLAGQAAPKLLASPQAQTAWQQANRSAHTVFLKIINGGGSLASTNGGVVTLNLHAIVAELASTLGIQQQVASAQTKLQANRSTVTAAANKAGVTLPPSNGQLVIMRSSQLKTAQDFAGGIKGLALVLPIITFALFILAVWLSRGRRREAVRLTGWCFVAIGAIALLARRVIGNYVVDGLVNQASNRTAGHHVWTIATTLLYDIGAALIVYGLVFVVATWIAGHTRPATALRRALAPSLRDRPVAAYVAAYVALLLVIIWGPTPATRQLAYIIGFIVLVGLAVHALRSQTAAEFPPGQAGYTSAGRRRPFRWPAAGGGGNGARVAELERLTALHDRGSLTDEEFAAEKAVVLNSS